MPLASYAPRVSSSISRQVTGELGRYVDPIILLVSDRDYGIPDRFGEPTRAGEQCARRSALKTDQPRGLKVEQHVAEDPFNQVVRRGRREARVGAIFLLLAKEITPDKPG